MVMRARRLSTSSRELAHAADPDSREGTWRTDDLPEALQDELADRLLQAEHGEGLLPYDEAMAEIDRVAEEILAGSPTSSR
jgi:hypothetical protein